MFTERDPATGKMTLRRGFTVQPGRNRGGGGRRGHHRRQHARVIELLHAAGARVLAAGSIIDRSGGACRRGRAARGAGHAAGGGLSCPRNARCAREGIPVVKPGSRPGLMRRIRITLAYDGTAFTAGRCSPACPPSRARSKRSSPESKASRCTWPAPAAPTPACTRWRRWPRSASKTRSRCPTCGAPSTACCRRAIRVLSAEEVHADFHPRFDAVAKTYEYRILRAEVCQPFRVAVRASLPVSAGRRTHGAACARVFEGEHDFTRLRRRRRARRRRQVQSPHGLFLGAGARRGTA